MAPDNFKDLLQKPMDRKDFLKHVGVGLVALTGVTTVVNSLINGNVKPLNRQQGAGMAYGSSAYGGLKNTASQTDSY